MPSTIKATGTASGQAGAQRAKMCAGFDRLPDEALIDVPTSAAVMGKGESTFWKDAKELPEHPKVIKVSTRCSRVRVGDVRRYLANLSGRST